VSNFPPVASDAVLPAEAFVLSQSQQTDLDSAYKSILAKCAASYGAQAVPVSRESKIEQDSRMWGGRFGTMTEQHAASLGYHAGPSDPVAPTFDLFANQGSEPLSTVLFGSGESGIDAGRPESAEQKSLEERVPKGGCIAQAIKKIGGDPADLVPPSVEKMRLKAYRDERTVAATKKWVACMASSGFKYKAVDGPVDQFSDGQPLSAKELAVATADVRCTKSSRWRDISFAIEKAYQERAIQENPEVWRDLKEKNLRILAKAKALALG
jgi:hypothetical protein